MEEEAVDSRRNRKEQERERRRLRDRERRQPMSQDEREKHLARRRKNYQLRRQRAEVSRIDSQIQAITGGSQATLTSPPDSGASLVESDQSVEIPVEELAKLMGPIRLSRLKHLARTLNKSSTTTDAEASNAGATDATQEQLTGHEPDISHIKTFGCSVYVLIAPPQRTKMGPQRRMRIYVGFDSPTIIKYLEPTTGDLFKVRYADCQFNESVYPVLGGETHKLVKEISRNQTSLQ